MTGCYGRSEYDQWLEREADRLHGCDEPEPQRLDDYLIDIIDDLEKYDEEYDDDDEYTADEPDDGWYPGFPSLYHDGAGRSADEAYDFWAAEREEDD